MTTLSKSIKRWHILFFFALLGVQLLSAQQNFTISGTLTDQQNGETLFGSTVFLKGTTIGVVTNEYGFYSLTAPAGKYTLVFSYLGYQDVLRDIDLTQNQKLDIELQSTSYQLTEVEVTAEEPERAILRKPEMSVSKLNISTV